MSTLGAVAFKIDFLRAMAPRMTKEDLQKFEDACKALIEQRDVEESLKALDELYDGFGGPEGAT